MSDDVLYDVKDRVATITLNRPDRLNAYNAHMAAGIKRAMARAADDADVRVIVLTGAGRGFCAGADMDVLSGAVSAGGTGAAQGEGGDEGFRSALGPDLGSDVSELPETWTVERMPLHLETSVPGVFVAGDVRHRSAKGVTSGVGEGAMAVKLVHEYLGLL